MLIMKVHHPKYMLPSRCSFTRYMLSERFLISITRLYLYGSVIGLRLFLQKITLHKTPTIMNKRNPTHLKSGVLNKLRGSMKTIYPYATRILSFSTDTVIVVTFSL